MGNECVRMATTTTKNEMKCNRIPLGISMVRFSLKFIVEQEFRLKPNNGEYFRIVIKH